MQPSYTEAASLWSGYGPRPRCACCGYPQAVLIYGPASAAWLCPACYPPIITRGLEVEQPEQQEARHDTQQPEARH
jgi:hypothetical protein